MRFFSNSEKASINKTAVYNMLGVVLLQGISFLTAPIFTRLLGASQYGEYGIFNAWTAVLSSFMGLNIGSAIGTGMYEFKEDYLRFRNSIFLFGILVSSVLTVAIVLICPSISIFGDVPKWIVILIPVYSMASFVTGFIQSAFIFEKKPFFNLLLSVSLSLATVVLSLALVFSFSRETRYYGRILGIAIPQIVTAVIIGALFFFKKPCGYIKKYWRFAISIGIPMVFHTLSQRVLTQSDRIMMKYMGIGGDKIGYYTVFYSFTSVLLIILSALNSTWVPFYYGYLDEGNIELLNKKSKNYIELLTVLSCGFILLSKEVGKIYAGEEYYSGVGVIPFLVLSVFFTFMYQFEVNFEMFYKKTKTVAIGTILAAICNVILNWILIPIWSLYGAAFATAISYGLLFCFHFVNVRFIMHESFHLNVRLFMIPLFMIMVCIILFYLDSLWYLRWVVGMIIGAYELLKICKRKSIY